MRPIVLPLAVAALAVATALGGCAADSASSSPTTGGAAPSGAALTASGAFKGSVVGTYHCQTTGTTTVVTMTSGGVSLVVRAVNGAAVEGAYLGDGRDFGGTIASGGGTVKADGSSATLTKVMVPARKGGDPLVLDGTVTCR